MSSTAQTAEGEKILIVDDDPGLSSLLERFFTSKGYRARAVANTSKWTVCWRVKCSIWWSST